MRELTWVPALFSVCDPIVWVDPARHHRAKYNRLGAWLADLETAVEIPYVGLGGLEPKALPLLGLGGEMAMKHDIGAVHWPHGRLAPP